MSDYHITYLPKYEGALDWGLLNNPSLGFPEQIAVVLTYTFSVL